MVAFIAFLAVYFIACSWFFIALLRWTIRTERGCACHGSFGNVNFVHSAKMCYPRAESLSPSL